MPPWARGTSLAPPVSAASFGSDRLHIRGGRDDAQDRVHDGCAQGGGLGRSGGRHAVQHAGSHAGSTTRADRVRHQPRGALGGQRAEPADRHHVPGTRQLFHRREGVGPGEVGASGRRRTDDNGRPRPSREQQLRAWSPERRAAPELPDQPRGLPLLDREQHGRRLGCRRQRRQSELAVPARDAQSVRQPDRPLRVGRLVAGIRTEPAGDPLVPGRSDAAPARQPQRRRHQVRA